ncbi:uncharacterized protein LOC128180109 [Crassostrea angulata]|uniref:uncharacterized protein LOC128180109 n=1 Tax=Magallana angulata TaxID=2784310 RepID=UPI0022B20E5C|nr:uncharacterized protein LOC128180109 [Crassostrea angulata]
MAHHTQLCIMLFGTYLFSTLLLLECRKLKGYEFPVYSTKKCPGNQAEWINRSSAINCTEKNGYMCTPNENFTDLLEFCYIYPRILVKEDLCLYLDKRVSRVNSYNCRKFTHGCPELKYFSSETYVHPSCMEIENGCFSAEPSCKRQPLQSKTSNDDTLPIILGVFIPVCILGLTVIGIKFGIRIRRSHTITDDEETELLLCGYEQREPMDNNKEYPIEEVIFDQWKQDDVDFISTKACEEVEKIIKSRNLVIVGGHSGSGKSAIIQHIALKYRERGWTVKRVKKVEDIVDEYYSRRYQKDKTVCVFNNPLGKESFDEICNDSWQRYEEDLKLFLKTAKILMSCRNHIISDSRVARYLVNQSAIVDIDDKNYKLSVNEKRHILTKYTSYMNLSDKDCNEIVKVERYFPLLCKLYSSRKKSICKGIRFFTEPVTVLKEEIIEFKVKDKGKYCALALLVLFNDDLCVSDLLKDKNTENKFKHTLKRCGLPESTPITAIGDNLDSLKDCFVKTIGDRYHFYHDLVMEVTTHVFGTDYPTETIKYADIGLLRKKVRLEDCKEQTDPFTIYLSDKYIEDLGERLFTELFGNRLIDVALNPCLKNKKVIETLKGIIQKHPEKLRMLLEKKKIKYNKPNFYTAKHFHLTKIAFMGLKIDLSPLYVLIVYSHTDLSLKWLDTLTRMHINFKSSSLLPAVYCNGSMQLFDKFQCFHVKESLRNALGGLSPIHIVSAFHNYELLEQLSFLGGDVNSISITWDHFTPLLLAAGNDTQENEYYSNRETGADRRDKTVQLLLNKGADINLCEKNGTGPLYIACQNGHDITVQLLLSNGADINLCKKNGTGPLYIACQNGHDSTVQLLSSYGANINLCDEDGASPLYIACQNGHDSTVQLLLSNGADINLCKKNGTGPLYIACQNGHDNTVQLLKSNGADINLCDKDGASPLYKACQNEHDSTVQLLLSNGADINLCAKDGSSPLYIACQNGHDSTVQLLERNGADIYLCDEVGASPLYIACQNGHDSILRLLLSYGANINLCDKDGASPVFTACQNRHFSTVQLLLSNGADINLCKKNGTGPLYIACQNGHDSTVQLLLSNGADINLCDEDGASPLYIACQNGHDSTVQLLSSNGANINLCDEDGASPLYIACQKGYFYTVRLLLNKGADINLCAKDGSSPLYIACQKGYFYTVQLLLSNGADINLCDEVGASPLYRACQNGHDSTVQLLLENRADINLFIKDGVSPLYLAFNNRLYKIVDILLNNGTDTSLACGWKVNPDLVDFFDKQDSTIVFLLQKNNILNNLYDPDSYFSLFVSCQIERVTRMIL